MSEPKNLSYVRTALACLSYGLELGSLYRRNDFFLQLPIPKNASTLSRLCDYQVRSHPFEVSKDPARGSGDCRQSTAFAHQRASHPLNPVPPLNPRFSMALALRPAP
jgi:hypothetical protein